MNDEFRTHPELIKKRARSMFYTRLLIGVVVMYALVVLTLVGINSIVSYSSRHQLLDCTTPGGDCYQDGQQHTANFIDQLIRSLNASSDERADTTRKLIVANGYCNNLLPAETTRKQYQDCLERMMK